MYLSRKAQPADERARSASATTQPAEPAASTQPVQPAQNQAAPKEEDLYKPIPIVLKEKCRNPEEVHKVYSESAQRQGLKLSAKMTE